MNITITGGSGFIGSYLCSSMPDVNFTAIGRTPIPGKALQNIVLDKPEEITSDEFPKGNVFIHLAGFSGNNKKIDPGNYQDINVNWPVRMIEEAIAKNYDHFIFMSTAKVHGAYSETALTSASAINPDDTYSESKLLAETRLAKYKNDIAITILRPPAVYGLPAIGGFKKIVDACEQKRILPICSTNNKRSFIGLKNLVSIIQHCLRENELGCRTFLIHDGEVISTKQFVELTASSIGTNPRYVKVPVAICKSIDAIFGTILSKQPLATLHRNFYIDCNDFASRYNWSPESTTGELLNQISISTDTIN